jgi:hypothetical protein
MIFTERVYPLFSFFLQETAFSKVLIDSHSKSIKGGEAVEPLLD